MGDFWLESNEMFHKNQSFLNGAPSYRDLVLISKIVSFLLSIFLTLLLAAIPSLYFDK